MSETKPTNDELHDAATDRLLSEALGGESPPDLRDEIVERFEASQTEVTGRLSVRSNRTRNLAWLSIAALLLVGATLQLWRPPVARDALSVARNQEPTRITVPAPAQTPSEDEIKQKLNRARQVVVDLGDTDPEAKEDLLRMHESQLRAKPEQPTTFAEIRREILQGAKAKTPNPDPASTVDSLGEEIEVIASAEPARIARQEKSGNGRGGSAAQTHAPQVGEVADLLVTESEASVDFQTDSSLNRFATAPAAAPVPTSPPTVGLQFLGRRAQPSFDDRFAYRQDLDDGLQRNSRRFEQPRRYREPPSRDRYAAIVENPFKTAAGGDAVSTFSIDVDTASYANVRQHLLGMNQLPPADAVRIEELVNYFDYAYQGPQPAEDPSSDEAPFAAAMEVGPCPWTLQHRLVRIGVKGREIEFDKRPLSNLVFLVDVSGSMNEPNKLPLLVDGLKRLTRQLGENDRVAIVVYASSEGLALESTPGSQRGTILAALDKLRAGGSTAGGAGIQLAYDIAERNFIEGGVNRVLLCTDGDFNVGVTDTDALGELVERKAKSTGVFLSVLGFGRGNLNDAMMETISGRGNGVYAYVDSDREAHRVLVRQMSGTLVTIAKDVKLQVEFNPGRVAKYRLIGYENRMLKTQDFNDDTKDAGEIGAGHTVTALYEVVPVGAESSPVLHEPLKYQPAEGNGQQAEESKADSQPPIAFSNELLTLKIRYKQPDESESTKLEFPLVDGGEQLSAASPDFKFACSVAEFGMLLRNSQHKGAASYDGVLELAEQGLGDDPHGDRSEFVGMVRKAKALRGE